VSTSTYIASTMKLSRSLSVLRGSRNITALFSQ
jgi:hypothetical protein